MNKQVTPPVMLLAGGLGTRLRSMTGGGPKVLASLAPGLPMLRYVLSYWVARGAREFVLCLGYQAEAVEVALSLWKEFSSTVKVVVEREPLGTGGAVLLALSTVPEEFFVINADTVIDVSLEAVYRWHRAGDWHGTVVVSRHEPGDQVDRLEISPSGAVTSFLGRQAIAPWAYAGVCLLRRSVLADLSLTPPANLEADVLVGALRAGKRLGGLRTDRMFYDLGTPERFRSFSAGLRND